MAGSKHQQRAQRISEQYAFQTQLIQQLVAGVSDEESLLQVPFERNCMNWILGHIISRRQSALEALGSDPLWGTEQLARYKTGSDPISTADQAAKFSILRNDLDRSMDMLQTALQEADHQVLDQVVINDLVGKKLPLSTSKVFFGTRPITWVSWRSSELSSFQHANPEIKMKERQDWRSRFAFRIRQRSDHESSENSSLRPC